MTAVEWLEKQLTDAPYIHFGDLFEQAKEMEKQQIIDAQMDMFHHINDMPYGLEYLNKRDSAEQFCETYGSKGSDTPHVTPQVTPQVTSSQTEISDESWEGCDGCTEQDEVMYKNGYVKGYNAAISELPKEISDEEIEKAMLDRSDLWDDPLCFEIGWKDAIKWYREQLKKKQ